MDDLEDLVTCWICFELFDHPITLYCNHTFCKSCLMKIYNDEALCPFCRRPFSYPFPDANHELIRLVHEFNARKQPTIPQTDQEMRDVDEQALGVLSDIPEEVLVSIFSHLSAKELGKAATVCSTFKRLSEDNLIWKQLWSNQTQSCPFVSLNQLRNNTSSRISTIALWKNVYRYGSQVNSGWQRGRPSDFKMRPLRSHTNYISHFQLFHNTSKVLSSSADSTIKLWDITKHRPRNEDADQEEEEEELFDPLVRTFQGHSAAVSHFNANELRLLSASFDSTVKTWDLHTGQNVTTLRHQHPVMFVSLNEPLRQAFSASGWSINLWDLRTSGQINTFSLPPTASLSLTPTVSPTSSATRSSNPHQLLFGGENIEEFEYLSNIDLIITRRPNSIQVWDSKGGQNPSRLSHPYQVLPTYVRRHYQISHQTETPPTPTPTPFPAPDHLPPGPWGHPNYVRLPLVHRRPIHPQPPTQPTVNRTTRGRLNRVTEVEGVEVGVLRETEGVVDVRGIGGRGLIYWIEGQNNCIKILSTVSNSADGIGLFLLVGFNDGFSAYDLKNGFEIEFRETSSPVLSIESDGKRIAVGTQDGALYIYEPESPSALSSTQQTSSSSSRVSSSSLSTEAMGEFLLTARLVGMYTDHTDGLTSIKMDERKVITGGRDNCIKVWDLGGRRRAEKESNDNQNQNDVRRLYSLLGGSLQANPKNPAHPTRRGCSGVIYDETKIVGSFNSLVRVYSFEEKLSV